MKKNFMMRMASVLLVAVLLSTCAISGTFAKYVTSASATDTARVAKWGIKFDNTGVQTFEDTYDSGKVATSGTTGDAIVAPGTKSDGVYKMTGKPETAYTVSFDFTDATTKSVFLKEGAYDYKGSLGYTTAMDIAATEFDADVNWFDASDNYCPIKFTVTLDVPTTGATINGGNFTDGTAKEYWTLAAAIADIEATTISYTANTECETTLTIAWEWAFEGQNDKMDTVLGDLAATNTEVFTTVPTSGTDYNLNIAYELKMTATQVN